MARNQVHVAMSAGNAQIVQAWLQANKGPQQMLNLLNQIGAKGQQSGQKVAGGMDRISMSVGRAISSFVGIGSALQGIQTAATLIREEWEILREAARAQVERAGPIAKMLDAFTPTKEFGREELKSAITDIALSMGVSVPVLANALGPIFAALPEDVLGPKAVEATLRAFPSQRIEPDSESISLLTKSIIGFQRAFPDVSVDEAAAFQKKFFQSAFVDTAKAFAETISPALNDLATLTEKGDRPEFLASRIAGISVAGQEPGGRITSNIMRIAANNMIAFLGARGIRMGSLEEGENIIKSDPKLRREFIGFLGIDPDVTGEELKRMAEEAGKGEIGGEVRMRARVAGMFVPGSRTSEEIDIAAKQIGVIGPKMVEDVRREAQKTLEDKDFRAALRKQRSETAVDVQQAATPEAEREELIQQVQNLLRASGESLSFARQFIRGIELRTADARTETLDEFRARTMMMMQQRIDRLTTPQGFGDVVTQDERQRATAIQSVINQEQEFLRQSGLEFRQTGRTTFELIELKESQDRLRESNDNLAAAINGNTPGATNQQELATPPVVIPEQTQAAGAGGGN